MDNIKQVVKDVRFLIATDCCDETIQARIENFINEREQALRQPLVSWQSRQLFCDCEIKGSSFQLNTGEICCCKREREIAK